MKNKTTNKRIKENYKHIIIDNDLYCYYSYLSTKTKKCSAIAFNCGIYGWNFDLFEFSEIPGLCVCSGYRGFPAGKEMRFNFSKYRDKLEKINDFSKMQDYKRYFRRKYIDSLKKIIEK